MGLEKKESIINRYGLKLAAISFIPDEYTHVLIICHGFKGAKENSGRIFNFAHRLNELKLGVLAFDFTGSGGSEGEFGQITLTGQVQDLADVITFAKQKYNSPLLLLGRSFGGSTIAASARLDEKIVGYVFWSAPVRLTETFSRFEPPEAVELSEEYERERRLRLRLLEDFKNHDMSVCLNMIKEKPALIIHGGADETVSVDNVEFFKQYLPGAEYIIVPDADHRFNEHSHIRDEMTLLWLQKILPGTSP